MHRTVNGLGAAACAAMLAYAWYAQVHLGLEPCPLCIFQRVGVAALGLLFLLAALHRPRRWGGPVYALLLAVAALATIGVAARHAWIQHLPPDAVPACGATLDYLLRIAPLTEVIRKVLTGSGECARVTWTLWGLSMPLWVLLAAAALGTAGVWVNIRRPPRAKQGAWG